MPELFNPPAINRSKSPTARHSDDTGLHHGETIPDPYRWLEDSISPETKAWVAAQNELTQAWLARVPTRDQIRDRLSARWNYPGRRARHRTSLTGREIA
jgi:prolyl oligopeptidase